MDIKLLDKLEKRYGLKEPYSQESKVDVEPACVLRQSDLRTLIAAAREGVRWKAEAMAARGLLHDSGLHIYAQHTEGQCVMMDDAAHEYVNERAANPAITSTPEPTQ